MTILSGTGAEFKGMARHSRKEKPPSARPYTGLLVKPMILPKEGLGDLVGFLDRIVALFDHYEVEHWNWQRLCLELASRHVPGFRFQSAPGAPEQWWSLRKALLIMMVNRERAGKLGRAGSISA